MKSSIYSIVFTALLAGLAPALHAAPAEQDTAGNARELTDVYRKAQEALGRSDWQNAVERFRHLEDLINARGQGNADAAVYWQSYALVRAKRMTEARRTVERLREKFPQSRWVGEAETLLRQAEPVDTAAAASGDSELAEIAVEGLMHAPPERAVPLLKKVLAGKQPDKVKRRALFVLSQIDSAEALAELGGIARTGGPELRTEAIRMLGVSGEPKALDQLVALYKTASTQEKREVLNAWMVADRKDLVLAAARDETDPRLRNDAINLLGAMEGTDELKQLLPVVKEPQLQRQIVQALGVAGDVDALVQFAKGDSSEALRLEAYGAIGISGGPKASAALVALYSSANSPQQRDAILQGLLINDDAKALVGLYRSAKAKEEKQQILSMLTAMDDDAALEIIEHELK
jgi:HEAT repeat protein